MINTPNTKHLGFVMIIGEMFDGAQQIWEDVLSKFSRMDKGISRGGPGAPFCEKTFLGESSSFFDEIPADTDKKDIPTYLIKIEEGVPISCRRVSTGPPYKITSCIRIWP